MGGKLIDRLWPNPEERDAAKLKLLELEQNGELAQLASETDLAKAQMAINEAEAGKESLFVSGWRPFIRMGMWSGICLSYYCCSSCRFYFIYDWESYSDSRV